MDTISQILSNIREYEEYQGLSDYYIKKEIAAKYKKSNKPELLKELERLQSRQFQLPPELLPNISQYLDIATARSLNKETMNYNQKRYIEKINKNTIKFSYVISYDKKGISNFKNIDDKFGYGVGLDIMGESLSELYFLENPYLFKEEFYYDDYMITYKVILNNKNSLIHFAKNVTKFLKEKYNEKYLLKIENSYVYTKYKLDRMHLYNAAY